MEREIILFMRHTTGTYDNILAKDGLFCQIFYHGERTH